jgi:hypothetical protein
MNYQILVDKEENVLRKTILSGLEDHSETNHNNTSKSGKRVDFLLCPSCFWCASYFNFGELSIIRCPVCRNNQMEQLPVSC